MTTTTTTYAVGVGVADIRRDPDPNQAILFFTSGDFFPIFAPIFAFLLSAWYIFTIILFPRLEKADFQGWKKQQMEKLIPKRIVSRQAEKVILDHDGEIRAHDILLRKVLKETPALIEGTTTIVFTSGNVICYTNDGVVWRPR